MSNFESHPLHPGTGTPIFIAAGVLKEPAQLEPFLKIEDPLAAPLLQIGGFTLTEWAGNAKAGEDDFVYYPDWQIAGNARGLPNKGKDGILSLKPVLKQLTRAGIKTVVQVTNLPHERPLEVIPELVEIAASVEPTAVEVNLSCPNGLKADGTLHPPLSSDADASGEVMLESRHRIGDDVVLGVKDSPHVKAIDDQVNTDEVRALSNALHDIIDFVTGINTIGNQPFPELQCAGGRGGMSGPVVNRVAHDHVILWSKLRPEIPYLSTGGIDSQNIETEASLRLSFPNVIRVGGAQEFYRAQHPVQLAAQWAIAAA